MVIDQAESLANYVQKQCIEKITVEHAALKEYLSKEWNHIKGLLKTVRTRDPLDIYDCNGIMYKLFDVYLVCVTYEQLILNNRTVIICVGGAHAQYLCDVLENHSAFKHIFSDGNSVNASPLSSSEEWITNEVLTKKYMNLIACGTKQEKERCNQLFAYFDSVWRKNRADISTYFQNCPIAV
jgi:hypothetical protein